MQFAPAFVSALATQRSTNLLSHSPNPKANAHHSAPPARIGTTAILSPRASSAMAKSATALKAFDSNLVNPEMMAFGKVGLSLMLAFGVSARALTLADKLKSKIDEKNTTPKEGELSESDTTHQASEPQSSDQLNQEELEPGKNFFSADEMKKLAIDLAAAYVIVQSISLVSHEFSALQQLNSPMEQMIRQADSMDNLISGVTNVLGSDKPPLN